MAKKSLNEFNYVTMGCETVEYDEEGKRNFLVKK